MKSFAAAVARMFPGLANKNRAVNSIGPVAKAPSKYAKVVFNKGTFNAGRNAEKRLTRADGKSKRALALKLANDVRTLDVNVCARLGGVPKQKVHIPKSNASKKLVDALANRRLRQRSLAA